MNRHDPRAARSLLRRNDDGRVILEALVGLALIAIAVVSWGRVSVVGARAEANASHRSTALELAANEIERLSARPWVALAVDPAGLGARNRFEGEAVVLDPAGVVAETTTSRDGFDYVIVRLVTDSGDPSWRHLVVTVTWTEGTRDVSVRLDGAGRRPATTRSS